MTTASCSMHMCCACTSAGASRKRDAAVTGDLASAKRRELLVYCGESSQDKGRLVLRNMQSLAANRWHIHTAGSCPRGDSDGRSQPKWGRKVTGTPEPTMDSCKPWCLAML